MFIVSREMSSKNISSFLELPSEVRCMIYEYLLPHAVGLGRQYYFNLANLQTSTIILEEVRRVMKHKSCLAIKIQDRESHLPSLWINNLGDYLASKIHGSKYGEVRIWPSFVDVDSASPLESVPLGSELNSPTQILVANLIPNYRLSCLAQRSGFSSYLQQLMAKIRK